MFTVRHSQSPSEAAKLHTWPVHAAFRHVGQRASGPVGQRASARLVLGKRKPRGALI